MRFTQYVVSVLTYRWSAATPLGFIFDLVGVGVGIGIGTVSNFLKNEHDCTHA
jgi:hypothetical protein